MSKVVRKAWLTDWSINGMPVVCFREKGEDFETVSTNCFKDKHEALLEISIFENRSFFEEMARS